jgi:hypothetical protein
MALRFFRRVRWESIQSCSTWIGMNGSKQEDVRSPNSPSPSSQRASQFLLNNLILLADIPFKIRVPMMCLVDYRGIRNDSL